MLFNSDCFLNSAHCFLSDLLQCLLDGMQSHLDSSAVGIRTLGMVVGECLSARMDLNGAKLKFEVHSVNI